MLDVMPKNFFLNLALFACVAGAAVSWGETLPDTALQLPVEVQQDLIYGASKPQYHWDADGQNLSARDYRCEAIRITGRYALTFNHYPHGGYMVLAIVDLVGDEETEKAFIVFEPFPNKGDSERCAYLYSQEQFCYTMHPQCIYSKKSGDTSRGWYLDVGEWHQWELREKDAEYVRWGGNNEYRYIFSPKGTLTAERKVQNVPYPILGWTNLDTGEYEMTNADKMGYAKNISKVTFYITSVYELIMTEKAEWMKWEGDLTQGLRHWNETREDVMKASRGTTAKQALEKLQSTLKQKPQLPAYPLFNDQE